MYVIRSFSRWNMLGLAAFACILMTGCLAQQADLAKIQQDLELRIARLDQKEKELNSLVVQANERIAEHNQLLQEKSKALKDLFKARAEIRQELRAVREMDLASLSGQIEEVNHRIANVEQDLGELRTKTGQRFDSIEAQLTDIQTLARANAQTIEAAQAQFDALVEHIDQDRTRFDQKFSDFQAALADFKTSLAALNDEIAKERQRATQAESQLTQQIAQTDDAHRTTLAEFQTALTALKESLGNLTDALTHETQRATQAEAQLAQQLDQATEANRATLEEFRTALTELKHSLTLLGDQLADETERATQAETHLARLVSQSAEANKTALAAIENSLNTGLAAIRKELQADQQQGRLAVDEALKTQTDHLQELERTITQIKAALEQSNTLLGSRVDDQDARLAELSNHVTRLENQIAGLTTKVSTDTEALKTYLEENVQTSVQSMATDLANRQQQIEAQVAELQSIRQNLETQMQANTDQVQELNQTVVRLREALGVMGELLGKRGDQFVEQATLLNRRLSDIEAHQAQIDKQISDNATATAEHLSKVNTNMSALNQTVQQTAETLAARIDAQDATLAELQQHLQDLDNLQTKLAETEAQLQATAHTTAQLQTAVQGIVNRLQDIETYQASLGEKLGSDSRVTTAHLTKVNDTVAALANALKETNAALNARIDEQARRLADAQAHLQTIQTLTETTQANMTHLNQLTDTVKQLRTVLDTIGTKLGGRVDDHEQRLAEITKRLNRLLGKQPSTNKPVPHKP